MEANKATEIPNNLETLLEQYNVQRIFDSIELQKIFDIKQLDEEKMPKIITEENTVIIFDNLNFNETYLIDVFNNFMDDRKVTAPELFENISKIKFYYINSPFLRKYIFNPNTQEANLKHLERDILHPGFMAINPKMENMIVIMESLFPLGPNELTQLFSLFY